MVKDLDDRADVPAIFQKGLQAHRDGCFDEAERVYRLVLGSVPRHAGSLNLLGVIRQQQGQHAEAIALIGRAIETSPGRADFHNNYGAALLSMRQFAEADASFRRAIALRPDYADALANLGMAQAALGNDRDAEQSFRRALQSQAWHRDAVTRFASLLGRQNRTEEAVRLLESAVAAAPCPEFQFALGSLRLATRQSLQAAKHYRIAMQTGVVPAVRRPEQEIEEVIYNGTFVGSQARLAWPQAGNSPRDPSLPKVAFISPHCVLGYTNGAATATLDGLKLLARMGFDCEAFCGSQLDAENAVGVEHVLVALDVDRALRNARIGPYPVRMIFTRIERGAEGPHPNPLQEGEGTVRDVPVTIVDTTPSREGWLNRQEVAAFLTGCQLFLDETRPNLVWTYGGDPVSLVVQQLAKQRGAKILFALHNFSYTDCNAFEMADHVVVPSEFSRGYYHERFGLNCQVLPNVVNWEADVSGTLRVPIVARVGTRSVPDTTGPHPSPLPEGEGTRYITFINPHADKGVYIFARIARELARRRPDIPILVTQGRSRGDSLSNPDLKLVPHLLGQFPIAPARNGRNITTMPFTPDPRSFYEAVFSVTRLLLMPSLWLESFGLVAAEAMLNGIPVLASNRGALPDTIGEAGFVLEIPARYTPETRDLPTAAEVDPWIEAISGLWDNPAEYDRCSRAARERADRWRPDRLDTIYRDFFSRIATKE
jgi:glycosyltransferase involved in cell wall biosynthesis/Tfp pilus assembly protein PilF